MELLEVLKSYPFLAPYQLTFCAEIEGGMPRYRSIFTFCNTISQSALCTNTCQETAEEAVQRAVAQNRAIVFHCHAGLLNFAVPLRGGNIPFTCLIGGGIRDKNTSLDQMVALALSDNGDAVALREELEALPVSSEDEVAEVAGKVQELLPSLLGKNIHSLILEKTMRRLASITGVSSGIDAAGSADEVLGLLSETFGILFDIGRIAVLAPEGGNTFAMKGLWGMEPELGTIPKSKALAILPRNQETNVVNLDEECRSLFPDTDANQATCIRFASNGELLGIMILFDATLPRRDKLLIQLITERASAKLLHLREEAKRSADNAQATKLMTMFTALSRAESKEELNDSILAMAADLVEASCGSLMFIDENGEHLKIEAALGMNMQLAKSMVVQVGNGIAGKVAAGGLPLLVNDIEKDKRIGIPNRPRFKTKSFVSIPIKLREETIGVLNLSDKKNQGIFTEADLNLLITFAGHASIMIERSLSIERAGFLEQLSITDPLTGLYNRRFLKRRMEEELARSIRQNLSLTVMMIDLDNFKIYNDLCGHLAGDRALKKMARILSDAARQMDVVTRYGGEEFCIILPGTSKKESIFVAERMRREIEAEEFPHEENLPMGRLTASVGVASYPEDGSTEAVLLKAADMALYRAKAEGRNRVVIANPGTEELSSHLKSATGTP